MKLILFLPIVCGVLAVGSIHAADAPNVSAGAAKPADAGDASSIDDLSRKTSDPTASLMALNFQGIYSTFHGSDVPGERDERWTLQFRPVIPFETFGQPNILRVTVPYQIGGRGDESWGRWGVGPVMSIDTTGDAQFTCDWEADRWVNVPVGFQIGKVTKLGKLPVKFAINPQYNLLDDRGLTKWSVSFTFTTLFPSF